MMRLWRLLLGPEPSPFGGGGTPEPSPTPAPAPTPEPTSGPDRGSVSSSATNEGVRDFDINGTETPVQGGNAPAPASRPAPLTPADPNQAVGAGVPANFQSIRDAAAEYGYSFTGDVADDRAALMQLVQRAQSNSQADYYAQIGRRLAPHATAIQGYLQQQQAPPAPTGRKPWEAPEFDERWSAVVVQDPQTGMWLSKPGVDPSFGTKVNEYVDWKRNYDKNPAGVINAMVEERARSVAQEVYAQQSAVQGQRQAAERIVQANSPWFYAQDQAGNRAQDAYGRPQPSPMGAAYLRHLGTVKGMGVTDAVAQDQLARALLSGEIALSNNQRLTQQQVAAAPAAQAQTYAPPTNPLQALAPQQRAITAGATEPDQAGTSLYARMLAGFKAAGITDDAFSPENFNS